MFITCQECNTTFRLDERLLKPTGSKVRCSQCRHTFIAMPPILQTRPITISPALEPAAPPPELRSSPLAEAQEHELEGIDLAELDAMLGEENIPQKPLSGAPEKGPPEDMDELDDLDLNLDFEAALESGEEGSENPAVASEGQDLDDFDLAMDFEIEDEGTDPIAEAAPLNLTPEPQINRPATKKKPHDDPGLALDELDLFNEEKAPAAVTPPPKVKNLDDLDLADFDLDLEDTLHGDDTGREEPELSLAGESDGEDEGQELELRPAAKSDPGQETNIAPVAGGAKGSLPHIDESNLDLGELDLELDTMSDFGTAESNEPSSAADDDLDFSELDSILATTAENKTDKSGKTSDDIDLRQDNDAELSLDIDESEGPLEALDNGLEEGIEDLEFELDSEFEEKGMIPQDAAAATPSLKDDADDDEIDLSDIEEMLGDQASAGAQGRPNVEAEELSLNDGGGEIDLSDFESAIDRAEEAGRDVEEADLELELELDSERFNEDGLEDLKLAGSKTDEPQPEEFDLDLELELESDPGAAQPDTIKAGRLDDDELDLSDLADLVDSDDRKTRTETVSTGDIDLEFQIEGDDEPSMPTPSAKAVQKMPAMTFDDTQTMVVEEKPVGKARPKPKRSSRTGLVMLLILLLLAGAGYGLYYAVTQMDVHIPYLSEYLNPPPADPRGNLNLSTLDINSKFIDNGQSGRLFVITGKVRNGYSAPRTTIRLQGKLFSKGKVLVKNEFSYAGTVIGDQELSTLSIAEIKQRLSQDVSGSVRPGQNLPFMLVFSDLPPADQLDEFAVEMVSSTPAVQ